MQCLGTVDGLIPRGLVEGTSFPLGMREAEIESCWMKDPERIRQIFEGEPRMKRFILLAVATVFLALQIAVGSVFALELDADVRTVKADEAGDMTVLSLEQVQKGKRLFNDTCSQCHRGGTTATNPNIDLSPEALAGAEPPRDNIASLVDYMKNPTTYDGEIEISEVHPSTKSADIYPEMRNLTDEDLEAIAGHILLQPKIIGRMWGGARSTTNRELSD